MTHRKPANQTPMVTVAAVYLSVSFLAVGLAIGFAAGLLIAYNVFDQHLKEVEAERNTLEFELGEATEAQKAADTRAAVEAARLRQWQAEAANAMGIDAPIDEEGGAFDIPQRPEDRERAMEEWREFVRERGE